MRLYRQRNLVRTLALTLAASWPQCLAAVIVLIYNYLVHKTYITGTGARGAAFPVAAGYLMIASGLSIAIKTRCSRRLLGLLGDAGTSDGPALLSFLKTKILCSGVSWLGSIPVIGLFAIYKYGSLHPVGFPHFCASIVVGLLVSVTYSLLLCVRELLQAVHPGSPARINLTRIVRLLPFAAAATPATAALMFLFFAAPPPGRSPAYSALLALLVTLMTAGGYGFALCYRKVGQDLQTN